MEESKNCVAKLLSLLKWVNTFEGIHCSSFEDLSTGACLLKCLQSFMPTVVVRLAEDPWKELFNILEEFCGCSLKKAISEEKILAGDQEHISRVVVLLLCVAVQSKENERIIGDIMSMEIETQRDIMFYIESTLAQVKSHAIVAGTFVSGVGEQLPSLEDKSEPSTPVRTSSGDDLVSTPVQPLAREPSDEIHPFPTPRRPPKTLHPSNFYNGLESSAGAKLLMSPAVSKMKTSQIFKIRRADSSHFAQCPQKVDSQDQEELSLLRHNVRVLRGSLDVETKLARDYYNELCVKLEEYEQLKKCYCQLQSKLECLHQMDDTRDELAQTSKDLADAQKSLVIYRDRAEALDRYKDKVADLETTVKDYEITSRQLEDAKLCSDKMEKSLMDKVTEVKHLELSLSKTTIELNAKSSHLEAVLQENRQHKAELGERERNISSLQTTITQLEGKLESKEGSGLVMAEQNKELSAQIETLQDSLHSEQAKVSSLMAEKQVTKVHMSSLQEETNQLRTDINYKISELASRDFKVQSMESNAKVLDGQLTDLQLKAKELEQDLKQKEEEIGANSNNLVLLTSQKAKLEAEVKNLQLQVAKYEDYISSLKKTASAQEDHVSSLTDKCSNQETKMATLASQCSEQLSSLQKVNDDLEVLKSEKSQLQSLLDSARQEMTLNADSSQAARVKMENLLNELRAEAELLRQKLSEQEDEIVTSKRKISLLSEEKAQMESTLKKDLLAKEDALSGTITATQEEIATLKNETELLNEALAKKSSELGSCTQSISSIVSEKGQLEKQVEELNLLVGTLQSDLANMKYVSETENKLVEEKEGVIQKLQSELKHQKECQSSLIDKTDKELSDLKLLHASQSSELADLVSSHQELQKAMSDTEGKLQHMERKSREAITILQDQLHKKSGTVSELKQEKSSLSQQIILLQSKFSSERETLNKERSSLEHSVEEKDSTIAALQKECHTLNDELHQQRVSMEELDKKLDGILKSEKSCLESLNQECVKVNLMEVESSAKDEVIHKLQEANRSLTAEAAELKQSSDTEMKDVVQKLDGVVVERDSLSKMAAALELELSAAKSRCTYVESEYQDKLKSLKEELSLVNENNRVLHESYQQAQLDQEMMKTENEKNEGMFEQVRQELRLSHSHSEKQSQFIDQLTRENNKLMHDNSKLQAWLSSVEACNKKESTHSDNLRRLPTVNTYESGHIENIKPHAKSGELLKHPTTQTSDIYLRPSTVSSMSSELPLDSRDSWDECTSVSTITAENDVDPSLGLKSQSSSEAYTYTRLLRSTANLKTSSSNPDDEENRLRELKRRNKRALPHLKSSYPVEMQLQPENILSSDNTIKNPKSKIQRTSGTSSSEEYNSAPNSARSDHYTGRKRNFDDSGEQDVGGCPSTSESLTPEPPKPPTDYSRRKQLLHRENPLQSTLQLRGYLNPSNKQSEVSQGTSFDIVFSPPKGKIGVPPKRLRERSQRIAKGVKSVSQGLSASSSTGVVKRSSPRIGKTTLSLRSAKQKPKE